MSATTPSPPPGRAKSALEAALEQRRTSATEPNLVDAATTSDALPMPEVLIALDRLGSGSHGLPSWYQQAARQAAATIRLAATSTQAAIDYLAERVAQVPGARLSDPQTSKDAAREVKVTTTNQSGRLLLEYARHDRHRARTHSGGPCPWAYGMTSEQAADLAPGVSLTSEYAKRVSDLTTLGLLLPIEGATVTGRSGRERQVYAITDAGRALADKMGGGA